jgi:hypothetical protein
MDACPWEVYSPETGKTECLKKLPGPCCTCERTTNIDLGLAKYIFNVLDNLYLMLLCKKEKS